PDTGGYSEGGSGGDRSVSPASPTQGGHATSANVSPSSQKEASTGVVRITLTPEQEKNVRADEARERLERAIERQFDVADNWQRSQHQALLRRLDVASHRQVSPLAIGVAALAIYAGFAAPRAAEEGEAL